MNGLRPLHYDAVRARLGEGRSHLLLGNGFSIDCNPRFRYSNLYQAAVESGLSERAERLFARLGTNNFEGVMRLLDDADWVGRVYNLIPEGPSELQADLEHVKHALVEAVSTTHLEHTGEIPDHEKSAAARFIEPYHNIFCVNYDLVLYWVVMHASDPAPYQDGFRADEDDPDLPHLVFTERIGDDKGLFYIHGALHLYTSKGDLRKHSWIRTGRRLTDLIRAGLDAGQYPLFVAEGTAEKKIEQIRSDAYLSYCLGKLGRIQNRVVVFGHSLGLSDRHILDTLAHNLTLRELYIGVYGDPESAENLATRASVDHVISIRQDLDRQRRRAIPLRVEYFDSSTAHVWR